MQKFRARRNWPSETQRFSSTNSRCIIEIWPAGPPKLMNPSLTQNRNASPNPTAGFALPGGSGGRGSGCIGCLFSGTQLPYATVAVGSLAES